jgi:hypothetical protein
MKLSVLISDVYRLRNGNMISAATSPFSEGGTAQIITTAAATGLSISVFEAKFRDKPEGDLRPQNWIVFG